MIPLLLPLFAALTPSALAVCESWGQVSPDEKVVFVGERATFYVAEGNEPDCGDVDQCVWSVDDDLGTLSDTTGSPVDWTAPDSLTDCLPISLRIYVECPGEATGSGTIDLKCTDAQREELLATRGSTIAGGGCGTPASSAALIFPALGLLRRRRRDHSQSSSE